MTDTPVIDVDSLTDEEVRAMVVNELVDRDWMEPLIANAKDSVLTGLKKAVSFPTELEEAILEHFESSYRSFLDRITVIVSDCVSQGFTTEDMRTNLKFKFDHLELYKKSRRLQMEAAERIGENFTEFVHQLMKETGDLIDAYDETLEPGLALNA